MSLAQTVAAEVRAEMARQKISGVRAGKALGWSQYYISVRLRGEVPFGLDDLHAIAGLLEVPMTNLLGVRTSASARLTTRDDIADNISSLLRGRISALAMAA